MDEEEKDREEEKGNIQGYYATVISEFKEALSRWLEKETENETIEDFEDRELDALLLKVPRWTETNSD